MSTNNSNNSKSSGNGSVTGGSIYIGAGGGGGSTGASNGTWQTFTIPVNWIGPLFITPEKEPDKTEVKKDNRDGCDCKKCKEFYPYSEPNQEDGTLICYACRHGY